MSGERADWVGKTVGEGRFHISRKLGEGGMGVVYQSYDHVLDTEVGRAIEDEAKRTLVAVIDQQHQRMIEKRAPHRRCRDEKPRCKRCRHEPRLPPNRNLCES